MRWLPLRFGIGNTEDEHFHADHATYIIYCVYSKYD